MLINISTVLAFKSVISTNENTYLRDTKISLFYFLLHRLLCLHSTTFGSSVADSPSIASTSSSEGSSVGGTTVTIESSGLFSIVKSPEILISETAKLSLTCNSLISTSIVSGIFSGVAVTSKLNNGCSTTPPSLAPTAH